MNGGCNEVGVARGEVRVAQMQVVGLSGWVAGLELIGGGQTIWVIGSAQGFDDLVDAGSSSRAGLCVVGHDDGSAKARGCCAENGLQGRSSCQVFWAHGWEPTFIIGIF